MVCRFCGSAETIAVSAWPDWATRLIVEETDTRFGPRAVENVRSQILKALPRGMREDFIAARKIRVACKRCHHGWMRRIDAQVRPLLIPLITGCELLLTPGAQRALAAWVAKTVMIAEFASNEGVITPDRERDTLRRTHEPPASWNIWIAKSSGRNWTARYVRHTAGLGPVGRKGVSKDTQSVTFGMGRILVHAMSSTVPGMKFELPGKAETFHFLWSANKATLWPPRGTLDHREIEDFNHAFNRDFGTPEVEHIGIA
jgi:hypothetical protein